MSKPPALRCAIYTRKSSEEGLEQEYNSLHAQRDACEAYIRSQVGEGWSALKTPYDDGGISGGTMERPGLKQMLADIAARRIDVVVVYKVDRLTRSLWDFAKIVEVFDKHGVSFVSVTQSFNTTSSMGRLTLNMLLSFAQFEREVTSERIRDKIAASKKKGMWMGGQPPLGYDAEGRTLKINEAEAESVRHIFGRYLELKSVHRLAESLKADGIQSKRSVFSTGRTRGGCDFDRGALFNMLSNPIYLGKIRHKEQLYDGLHPPIIDQETFEQVEAVLATNRVKRTSGSARRTSSPLMGKLFDQDGEPMTPTFSAGRSGKKYRYYVSASRLTGKSANSSKVARLPGPELERAIQSIFERIAGSAEFRLERVSIRNEGLELSLVPIDPQRDAGAALKAISAKLKDGERAWIDENRIRLTTAIKVAFRGGRTSMEGDIAPVRRTGANLVAGLRRAHGLAAAASFSPLAPPASNIRSVSFGGTYENRLGRLAYLAPDLQQQILEGRQPAAVVLERLLDCDIPLSWAAQRNWAWALQIG